VNANIQKNDPSNVRQKVFRWGKFVILAVLFAAIFWVVPFRDVWEALQVVDLPYFIAGILIALITIYIRAARIRVLTKIQDLDLSTFELFKVNLGVKFYLLFLPGAIIGSGLRWAKVTTKGKSAEALAAVGFNRLVETYFIVVTGLFWYVLGLRVQKIGFWTLIAFIFVTGLFWLLFIWISKLIISWVRNKEGKKDKPGWNRIWNYIQRLAASIKLYADLGVKGWGILFGISVLAQLVSLVSYVFVAISSGIHISILNLAWIQSVVQLGSLTPLSIAGGLGLREVSLVILLPIYGVPSQIALAFSFLLLSRNLVLSLLGGLFELIDFLMKRTGDH
jgi:uncharacterized protein (TIRG00374 family)